MSEIMQWFVEYLDLLPKTKIKNKIGELYSAEL